MKILMRSDRGVLGGGGGGGEEEFFLLPLEGNKKIALFWGPSPVKRNENNSKRRH